MSFQTSQKFHAASSSRGCHATASSSASRLTPVCSRPHAALRKCPPVHLPFTSSNVSLHHHHQTQYGVEHRSKTIMWSTQPISEPTSSPEEEEPVGPPGVPREEWDFDYLQTKVDLLATELAEALGGTNIYLVGMMGTGKTTIGRMLGFCLKYCNFDVDTIIEQYHQGTSVAEIFKSEGEDYFRTCETEVLKQLSPYKNCVISTGGGSVVRSQNWSYMQHGVVVWLQGRPELLAQRVVADGPEKRPLLYSEGVTPENVLEVTTAKLQKVYEDRKEMYATADIVVSLEGLGPDEDTGAPAPVVLYRLMTAVLQRIKESAEEREEMKNFTIEGLDEVPTMKVMESPLSASEAAPEE